MTKEQLRRKADQEWEMAGLARQDGDHVDEAKHTAKAREYQRQINAERAGAAAIEIEERAGECLTCGTQCSDEGICPLCAALERAEETVLQATVAVLVPGLGGAKLKAARKTLEEAYAARAKALSAPIESCRKCGKALHLRDTALHGDARADQGEGDEAGNVFIYCSEKCRETH